MSRLKVYDLATGTWGYAGGVNSVALATDPEFVSRYEAKETFQQLFSGAGAVPNTGTTLVTLTAAVFPIAGWVDITAVVSAQIAIINDSLTVAIVINGAPVYTVQWVPGPAVVGTIFTTSIRRALALAAGTHTIRLDAAAVNNNAYTALSTTSLLAVYHR